MNRFGATLALASSLVHVCTHAITVDAGNGFHAVWGNNAIGALSAAGALLPGVTARVELIDPRTHQPVDPAEFALVTQPIEANRDLPGFCQVRTGLTVPVAGAEPVIVVRAANVHFTPIATARVERTPDPARKAFFYKVIVQRLTEPGSLLVKATGTGAVIEPAEVELSPAQATAQSRVAATEGKTEVVGLSLRCAHRAGQARR